MITKIAKNQSRKEKKKEKKLKKEETKISKTETWHKELKIS